jgi:hypothetical protein
MRTLNLNILFLAFFITQSVFAALGPCGRIFYTTVTGVFSAEVLDEDIRELVLFKAREPAGAIAPSSEPLILKVELTGQSFYFVVTRDKLDPINYTTVGMTGGGDWPFGLSYLGSRSGREGLLISRGLRLLYRNSIRTVVVGATTALFAWSSSLSPDSKVIAEGAGGIVAALGMIGGLTSAIVAANAITNDSFASVDTDALATQLVSGVNHTQRGWLRSLLTWRKKFSQTFILASFPGAQTMDPANLVESVYRKLGGNATVELITVSDLESATLVH